jgi:hypothetical protein
MNLETTRLRGRPRNRWQDKVREDGRIVGGGEWQEKYIREEWKKLLGTAGNRRILHMPMEQNRLTQQPVDFNSNDSSRTIFNLHKASSVRKICV